VTAASLAGCAPERLYDEYWAELEALYRRSLRPVPGAYALALALRGAGVPLAIVSNSRRHRVEATIAIAAPLLAGLPIVGREACARPKPAPDLYLAAADLLSLPPASCLCIEDSDVGVQAARAAGMTVLRLDGRPSPGSAEVPAGPLAGV